MPTLPGLSIDNQAIFDRVAATFPGATQAEKIAAYRAWLKMMLTERVRSHEEALARVNIEGLLDSAT